MGLVRHVFVQRLRGTAMTLSRTFRKILGIVSIAALFTAGLIAPPAQGGGGPGTKVVFNCDNALPTNTTILTLPVEEQFFIQNTGVGSTCRLSDFTVAGSTAFRPLNQGLINATNLAGASFAQVPSGQTSLVTVKAHGTFLVSGTGTEVHTIIIESAQTASDPSAQSPSPFTFKFDSNGGTCTANDERGYAWRQNQDSVADDLSVIEFMSNFRTPFPSGEQCVRDQYRLDGWGYNGTATSDPDGQPTSFFAYSDGFLSPPAGQENSLTLYAYWTLVSSEVTYDSNVPEEQDCGNLPRTSSSILSPSESVAASPSQINGSDLNLCMPESDTNRFYAWNTQKDGTGISYYPFDPKGGTSGSRFSTLETIQRSVTLYAQWAQNCPTLKKRERNTFLVSPLPSPTSQWMGCDLVNANLTRADLSGVNLQGANLQGANLTAATLSKGTNLNDANLLRADLSLLRLSSKGSDFVSATRAFFFLAQLFGAQLSGTCSDCGAKLTGAVLIKANLFDAKLKFASLQGATLRDANMENADLDRANLQGADLSGVNLKFADLEAALLSGVNLTGADLEGVKSGFLIGTPTALPTDWVIRGGSLPPIQRSLIGPGADLKGANLMSANLKNLSLRGADLEAALLNGADLRGADLEDAKLNFANLRGAKLRGANLEGVELEEGDITSVLWQGVTFSEAVTVAVLDSNVVTLTSVAHGFEIGEDVTVAGLDAVYNGAHTITAKTADTFDYAKKNANVASASVTGTATTPTTCPDGTVTSTGC